MYFNICHFKHVIECFPLLLRLLRPIRTEKPPCSSYSTKISTGPWLNKGSVHKVQKHRNWCNFMLSFLIFLYCKRNIGCSLLESYFKTANVEVRQRSDSIHKYQIPQQIQLSGASWPQTFHSAAVSAEESIYVCSKIFWEVTKSTQQLEMRTTTFNKGHKDWRTSHTNHCHSKWSRNDKLAGTQASISRLRSLCLHMLWIPSPLFHA